MRDTVLGYIFMLLAITIMILMFLRNLEIIGKDEERMGDDLSLNELLENYSREELMMYILQTNQYTAVGAAEQVLDNIRMDTNHRTIKRILAENDKILSEISELKRCGFSILSKQITMPSQQFAKNLGIIKRLDRDNVRLARRIKSNMEVYRNGKNTVC